VPGREIVVDHDLVSGLSQRLRGMTADVASPAGNQDHMAVNVAQWSSR
jgi:hypothetical protein